MDFNNALFHYGIPGMKWGVRRYQNKDGSYTSAGKKRRRASSKSETKRTFKDPSELSDDELRSVINRLRMEQEYSKLVSNTTTVSKGRNYVQDFFKATKDVAGFTATALLLYNNAERISKLIKDD